MKTARPGLPSGLLVAAMLTVTLIAILFFGWRVIGLPFVPFDVFDWLTRMLPGRVIAFGIGSMVTMIRALSLGPTSETAKLAEQVMAIANLLIAGAVGGTISFVILRARSRADGVALGLVLGAILGVPAMLISLHASATASVGPSVRAVWAILAFLVWGAVVGRSQQRLLGIAGLAAGSL